MKHFAVPATLALVAALSACAPVQMGASSEHPVLLSRPDEAVNIAPGQTVYVAQTVSASVVGVEAARLADLKAETPVNWFRLVPNGLPMGWSLTLEHASVLRLPLTSGNQDSGRVRLYLRVSAPKSPSKNPQALAYRLSYQSVDTPLALNVDLRR